MRTRLTLAPGHRGAKQLLARYGDQLICVRYRYDEQLMKRFKTVELIIEESDWLPQAKVKAGDRVVSIRVAVSELDNPRPGETCGWRLAKRLARLGSPV